MDRSDSKWKSNVNQEDSVAKFAVFRSTHLVRLRRVAKSEATSSSTHEPRWIFHTNGSRSINHDHTELDNRPSTERMRWESIQSAGRRFRADIIERQRISMLPFRVSCLPLPNQLEILFQLTATHTHTHLVDENQLPLEPRAPRRPKQADAGRRLPATGHRLATGPSFPFHPRSIKKTTGLTTVSDSVEPIRRWRSPIVWLVAELKT